LAGKRLGDVEFDWNANLSESRVRRVSSVRGTRPAWITTFETVATVETLDGSEPHPSRSWAKTNVGSK